METGDADEAVEMAHRLRKSDGSPIFNNPKARELLAELPMQVRVQRHRMEEMDEQDRKKQSDQRVVGLLDGRAHATYFQLTTSAFSPSPPGFPSAPNDWRS